MKSYITPAVTTTSVVRNTGCLFPGHTPEATHTWPAVAGAFGL